MQLHTKNYNFAVVWTKKDDFEKQTKINMKEETKKAEGDGKREKLAARFWEFNYYF